MIRSSSAGDVSSKVSSSAPVAGLTDWRLTRSSYRGIVIPGTWRVVSLRPRPARARAASGGLCFASPEPYPHSTRWVVSHPRDRHAACDPGMWCRRGAMHGTRVAARRSGRRRARTAVHSRPRGLAGSFAARRRAVFGDAALGRLARRRAFGGLARRVRRTGVPPFQEVGRPTLADSLPWVVARDMLRAVPPPGVAHVAPANHPAHHPRDRRAPGRGAARRSKGKTGASPSGLDARDTGAERPGPARAALAAGGAVPGRAGRGGGGR